MSRSDALHGLIEEGGPGSAGPRPGWLWLARLCGWVLGGIFVYAGISKMLDPAQLALQVRNYQLAPWWMIHPAAIVLPWIEIVAGLLLILGIWAIEATIVLAGLLLLFVFAIGWAMYHGLDIECGCFAGHAKVGWLKLAENAALLAVAALGVLARGLCKSTPRGPLPRPTKP
jgi:putative oxidoreductase